MPPPDLYVRKEDCIRCSEGRRLDSEGIHRRTGTLEVEMGVAKAELKTIGDIARDTDSKLKWLAVEIMLVAILIPIVTKALG